MFNRHYFDVLIWQTDYVHQTKSSDITAEFVRSTALLPYLERLMDEQAGVFLRVLRNQAARYYMKGENGKVLFSFKRIFIIGR